MSGGASLPFAQTIATLDEVVVTASRMEESRREITSNVTVISEEDIKASTASTLADLAAEHGLQVYTTGDTSNVYIRGYGSGTIASEMSNAVLTLINGRRIGNANLAIVGLANVKRVEIIRGPAAVQYGPAAMGGVINIITKQGVGMDTPYVSAEAGIGSDALHRERVSFGGAAGGFDFAMGLTNYGRDDVTIEDGQRWNDTDVGHNAMMNIDLGYTIADAHRAGINFNYGNIESTISGAGFWGTPYGPPNRYNKSNRNIALNYAGNAADKAFNWLATYSFGSDDNERTPLGGAATISTVDNKVFNAQAGYTAGLFSLSTGVDYFTYTEKPSENKQQGTGVYFTGKLRLLDERLIFTAGGRYDSYFGKRGDTAEELSESNFGGSVGAAYLPVNWLKLRVNYAEGFKVPVVGQKFGNEWYYPNPDLQPEKNKTVEFGADINWNYIDVALTYFHSDWKDKNAYFGGGVPAPYYGKYVNLKTSTLAGLESSFRVDLGKAFGQDFGLTPYTEFTLLGTRWNGDETQYVMYEGSSNDILPNTPKWMVSYGVDYNNPALKLKTRLSANRYGEVFVQDWDVTYGWIVRPAGTVVNLSAERELARLGDRGGALTLRTEINNLFDGKNEVYFSYPGPGRNFYVGLRYNFN